MAKSQHPADDPATVKVGDRVSIFQRKGVWQIQYQLNGQQVRRSLKTKSKKQATLLPLKIDAELLAGVPQELAPDPPLGEVIELYDSYLVTEGGRERTLTKYRYTLKLIAESAAKHGVHNVSQFDIRFVDRFRKARKEGTLTNGRPASPKTVFQDTVLLRQLVNFAYRRKLIVSDPLTGLTIKRPPKTPQPCWSQNEVTTILNAAEPPYRAALTILARTGMRVGELIWLTWDDVDFHRNLILIRPKEGWRPKSRNQRSVPIDEELLPVLKTLPRHGRWVVNAKPTAKYPKPGRQLVDRLLLADLKRLLKTLGLPDHLHTFISDASTKGVPERVLREWIGHVDPQILAWYYKLSDPESQAAMQRLSAARRGQDSVSTSAHFQHTEVPSDN